MSWAADLSVFLGQGQPQSGEELVHGHMNYWGKLSGEHDGQLHEQAVRQELGEKRIEH